MAERGGNLPGEGRDERMDGWEGFHLHNQTTQFQRWWGLEINSIKNWKVLLTGSCFQKMKSPLLVREEVSWPLGQEMIGAPILGKLKERRQRGVGWKPSGAHQAAEGHLP